MNVYKCSYQIVLGNKMECYFVLILKLKQKDYLIGSLLLMFFLCVDDSLNNTEFGNLCSLMISEM